jgi:hypothetical protein
MALPGVKSVIKDVICCGPGPHLYCGHTNTDRQSREEIIAHHERSTEFYTKRAQELTEEIADVLERIAKCQDYARQHNEALIKLDPDRAPAGPITCMVTIKDGCTITIKGENPVGPTPYPEGFSFDLHPKRGN